MCRTSVGTSSVLVPGSRTGISGRHVDRCRLRLFPALEGRGPPVQRRGASALVAEKDPAKLARQARGLIAEFNCVVLDDAKGLSGPHLSEATQALKSLVERLPQELEQAADVLELPAAGDRVTVERERPEDGGGHDCRGATGRRGGRRAAGEEPVPPCGWLLPSRVTSPPSCAGVEARVGGSGAVVDGRVAGQSRQGPDVGRAGRWLRATGFPGDQAVMPTRIDP